MMILFLDVTPSLGPSYTLLAFIIVIVGGLGSMTGALVGGVLIGLSEALAGLFIQPSAKSMFCYALLILVLLFRPAGPDGQEAMNPRAKALLAALGIVLLAACRTSSIPTSSRWPR